MGMLIRLLFDDAFAKMGRWDVCVLCFLLSIFFFLNSMSFGFCWLAWSVLLSFPFLNSIIPEVLPQGALSFLRRSLESVWTLCFHCIVYLNTKQRNWAFWVPQEVSDFIQLSEFFMVLHLYSVCAFFLSHCVLNIF